MKIVLLLIGKNSERYISDGVNLFSDRIRKYSVFEIYTIPDLRNTRNMPAREQKIKEGEKILQFLGNDDYMVVLDEKGRELSTLDFSSMLEKFTMLPKKRIVFVAGGAWGCSEAVYEKSDMRLSLSRMTFSHQIVRILFLEQLYRAFTILKGDPYHHE